MTADRGRFLRLPDVTRETGLSKSTIRRREIAGEFPRRVKLSENACGWWAADIDRWAADRRQAAPG